MAHNPRPSPAAISTATRRNMARVLVASGEFSTVDIDQALGLPPVTAAGFMAAMTRYGKDAMSKRDPVEEVNGHTPARRPSAPPPVVFIRNPAIAQIFQRVKKTGDRLDIARDQAPNPGEVYRYARKQGLKVSILNTDTTTTVIAR